VITRQNNTAVPVAVIDGPYDAGALSGTLARAPISLGNGGCRVNANIACNHGTFIMGLLGARRDAFPPGLCPDCKLLHVPLFADEESPSASIDELANAISIAVIAGAKLINLSLAIIGDDKQSHHELALALDRAEASGAVVVVAAGNQGRLAMGQLLSHPVTVPVVAVDVERRMLPDANFGPSISRRGVAALGHQVIGYAPGGGRTMMSGTSIATAIATGTLAQLWSTRPTATAAYIRAAIGRLGPRDHKVPPVLDGSAMARVLDAVTGSPDGAVTQPKLRIGAARHPNKTGERDMQAIETTTVRAAAGSGEATAIPAGAACDCGSSGGECSCGGAGPPVYVIGTIDVHFPDPALENEIEMLVRDLGLPTGQIDDQTWLADVLSRDEARHITRELYWILSVERQDRYVLKPRDPRDWSFLIEGLRNRPLLIGSFVADSHVVVGAKGPEVQIGDTLLHVLVVDRISVTTLTAAPAPTPGPRARRTPPAPPPIASPSLRRLLRYADNYGDNDAVRAINYLIARHEPLYDLVSEREAAGYILRHIDVASSRLIGKRRIVDPIISFFNATTGVEDKYFVRVDVTHKYPMNITDIEPL
jgi:hypothetical protein